MTSKHHVKLKGVHPARLEGPKISPVSVSLTTKVIGACLLLCKSELLYPWHHIQCSFMKIKSSGHQLAD